MPSGRALATVGLDKGCDVLVLFGFLVVSLPFVASAAWVTRIVAGAALRSWCSSGFSRRAGVRASAPPRAARARSAPADRTRPRRHARGTARPPALRRSARARRARVGDVRGHRVARRALDRDRTRGDGVRFRDRGYQPRRSIPRPAPPGFVGTYQWLAVSALGILDVPRDDALAFSILLQASWYVPTTLVGGFLVLFRLRLGRRPASWSRLQYHRPVRELIVDGRPIDAGRRRLRHRRDRPQPPGRPREGEGARPRGARSAESTLSSSRSATTAALHAGVLRLAVRQRAQLRRDLRRAPRGARARPRATGSSSRVLARRASRSSRRLRRAERRLPRRARRRRVQVRVRRPAQRRRSCATSRRWASRCSSRRAAARSRTSTARSRRSSRQRPALRAALHGRRTRRTSRISTSR